MRSENLFTISSNLWMQYMNKPTFWKGLSEMGLHHRNLSKSSSSVNCQFQIGVEGINQNFNGVKSEIINDDILKASLKHPDFFHVADMFTVEDLFKANVHLGHGEGMLDTYMRPYIFGSRLGHLIFDLDQTAELLRDALNITAHIAFRDGIILLVCKSAQFQILVEKTAEDCKEFAHTRDWNPRTFTDSTSHFGCVTRLPDLLLFLNIKENAIDQHAAIRDSTKLLIPTVGIVDSNCDPRLVTYPIPGNDDTFSAVKLYCRLFKNAILRGKQRRKELLGTLL